MDQNVGPTAGIEPPNHPGRGLIYGKLAKVMAELPAVGKDSVNQQQGWNFRGVDAVVNAISPALRNHGVVVVPQVVECAYRDTTTAGRDPRPTREVTVRVAYTFYAEDGSSVTATVPGESLDQSDKGSAKAMSVAFRIALLQVFALPTSEPDPDASYHTRDGGHHLTAHTRNLILASVPTASFSQLAGSLWPVVRDHDAQQRPIADGTPTTWAAYFAQRAAELIEQIEVWEEGRDALGAMRSMDNLHDQTVNRVEGGEPVALVTLLEERAAFIKARRQEAFDKMMADITGSTSLEELDGLAGEMSNLLESRVLSEKQVVDLAAVLSERYAKLEREQNVAAEPDQMAPGDERTEDLAAADAYREEPSGAED